jgi:hypothetical protein
VPKHEIAEAYQDGPAKIARTQVLATEETFRTLNGFTDEFTSSYPTTHARKGSTHRRQHGCGPGTDRILVAQEFPVNCLNTLFDLCGKGSPGREWKVLLLVRTPKATEYLSGVSQRLFDSNSVFGL